MPVKEYTWDIMLGENQDGHLSEGETVLKINPYAQEMLDLLTHGQADAGQVQQAAEQFLQGQRQLSLTERGLTSYLILTSFHELLPDRIRGKLIEILENAQLDDQVVKDLFSTFNIARQEVHQYFTHQASPYDYFIPFFNHPDNVLANILLSLECRRIANSVGQKVGVANHPNLVVEAFSDVKNGQLGIWMSTQGIHFDPKLLT